MHPLFAITIFTAILSLAECKKYHPHTILNDVCRLNMTTWMKATIMEAKCKPRPTLVELAPLEGYEFNPTLIMVNQCIGFCSNNACVPVKTKNVTRYVRRIALTGPRIGMADCSVVQIEEHETCGCMCRTTEADCNARQDFNPLKCKCECNDPERKKAECEVQRGMKWMEDECECKCFMKNMECTSGQKYNRDLCKCV